MKRLLFLLLAFTVAHATGSSPNALDAPVNAPAGVERPVNLRIELQVVAIPDALAVPLAADMMKADKIEADYVKIQEMLAKGVAKLIGWPIILTKSGQRAVYERVTETRYGTAYSPPTVNITTGVSNDDATTQIKPKVDAMALAGIPTAFETRNTGVTLEVEPVLQPDGKTIDMSLVPQDVRLKGFNKVTIERPAGTKVVVEQPQFDSMKLTTSLTVRSGQRTVLGVYPITEPAKHMEFFILKAEAIPVE